MKEISVETWMWTLIGLYATFGVFWLLQRWLARHIQGLALLLFRRPGPAASLYFFLIAPGVAIHELSHWSFAKLLFVRTGNMALFRPGSKPSGQKGKITLGYVEIYRSDPIRQSLIGLAPLPVGILVLLILAVLLGINQQISNQAASGDLLETFAALPGQFITSFSKPLNLLWLYLVFTVSNGMLPSAPDRKPWLVGFFVPAIIIIGLTLAGGLKFSVQTQQGFLNFIGVLTWVFAFAAVFNFLLAFCIAGLEFLVSHLSQRRIVYRRR